MCCIRASAEDNRGSFKRSGTLPLVHKDGRINKLCPVDVPSCAVDSCSTTMWLRQVLLANAVANAWKSENSAEEEEEFYKLRPANKTDHLCQSWQ